MALTDQTIDIYRGEEVLLPFTMSPVVDITGWTITWTVSETSGSKPVMLQRNATVTSGPAGTFTVALDADDATALRPGTWAWDAWRVDAEAERCIAIGSIIVRATARV